MANAKANPLSEGELQLYELHIGNGLVPVGVDLAARTFQVCYLTEKHHLKNKSLNRKDFFEFLTNPPFDKPMLVGFEACGACNYFARFIANHGHKYKIMQAKAIRSFLLLNKTDAIDAVGIFKGVLCPSIKTVTARDEENQVLMNLLTIRERLIKQNTQCTNTQRAMLYELGCICGAGAKSVTDATASLQQTLSEQKSPALDNFNVIADALNHTQSNIEAQIKAIDTYLENYAKKNATVKNLMTIPGIGLISAVTLYAVIGNPDDFPSSRHFASFAGFAPSVSGTGGIVNVGSIPHSGNKLLKKILFMCAVARFSLQSRKASEREASKLTVLINDPSRPNKKIICSLANRLARVAWTIAKSGEKFDAKKCRLLGE